MLERIKLCDREEPDQVGLRARLGKSVRQRAASISAVSGLLQNGGLILQSSYNDQCHLCMIG